MNRYLINYTHFITHNDWGDWNQRFKEISVRGKNSYSCKIIMIVKHNNRGWLVNIYEVDPLVNDTQTLEKEKQTNT